MRINTNITAMNTLRQLNINSKEQAKSMAKLSSGLRINSAADDAAGLAISEKMKGQINGLDQAARNAQDGQSLVQTAEGALGQTTDILQRMRELAVQSSNDTNTADDRKSIQIEIGQLNSEIDNIANTTQFNTQNLLTGSLGVSTSNGTNITQLAQTSDTKSGTLNLTADATLATQATATLTLKSGITTAQNDGTLNITANGSTYNIGFSNGQSLTDIAQNISNTVKGYTATFDSSTGKLTLTSTDVNADQSVSIAEKTADSLDGNTDFTTAATGTGKNATGLADSAGDSFSYNGNQVTVTSGNFKGLSFTLTPANAGDATASTNGSSITVGGGLQLQIGANQGQTMTISINAMDSQNLGISGLDVSTQDGAESAISKLDNAITSVSSERAKLGAYENRLDDTINNLNTNSQNTSDAQSNIADVDMAAEMSNQTKYSILSQAAQAMLAQANQQPQQVLQLLR